MRRVVVDMQNYLFADAISLALKSSDSDFEPYRSENPENTLELCRLSLPCVLIMEVTGYTPWLLSERLSISEEVKQQNLHCKTVIVVDERVDKKTAQFVLQAKKEGLIDQFIYSSISASYLVALIDSL